MEGFPDLGEYAADGVLVERGCGGGEPDSRPEKLGEAVDLFAELDAVVPESAGVVDGEPDSVRLQNWEGQHFLDGFLLFVDRHYRVDRFVDI